MTLPALSDWDATRIGLHKAAQVLGAVRKPFMPRDEKMFLHLALDPHPKGLTSGEVDGLGTLILDFEAGLLRFAPKGRPNTTIVFKGKTADDFFAETVEAINAAGITLAPEWDGDDTELTINPTQAAAYRDVLTLVTGALADFRDDIGGTASPVVVWPHGFDAAFAWFPGGEFDEHQPHIAFGFSPGSEGFAVPYFYAYAYPWPDDLPEAAPGLMRWSGAAWNGLVLDYATLRDRPNPREALLAQCQTAFNLFKP